MNIGIDARLWQETGVGRYIRALVENLAVVDKQNNYTLFLKSQSWNVVKLPNSRWQKIKADVSWHTLNEQILMPIIYKRARLDLLHIPYFAVPVFTSVPFVVTIHDLTISHFATGKATTKPLPLYAMKQMGYRLVLAAAVKRAVRVITVSRTVKSELLGKYRLAEDKVIAIYEAGTLEAQAEVAELTTPEKFILYVGNAHPHKNLDRLVEAYKLLQRSHPQLKLVLIGREDYFYRQLKKYSQELGVSGVIFPGEADNGELAFWYKRALAFIFPSLSEGFGIPGLEAMSLGCPVVASNIAVFKEIYGDAAVYTNPYDPEDLAKTINNLIENTIIRSNLVTLGQQRAKNFSWKQMAERTMSVYENCLGLRPRK